MIYQKTAKYKAGYIGSTFAGSERGMFLSERILGCTFWQRILGGAPKFYIGLPWDGKREPD